MGVAAAGQLLVGPEARSGGAMKGTSSKGKTDRRSRNLDALTGLRFIAAWCIVMAHLTTGSGYRPFGLEFALSPAGMPLFFTLSGFIIHYVYSNEFTRSWPRTALEFAVARFSRLFPLFGFLLLYSLLFTSLGKALSDSPWILLSYATMTASWWYWHIEGISLIQLQFGWSWSVSTEVFFYVVYAAVLYRISGIRRLSVAVAVFTGFCVLSYVLLIIVIEERDAWTALAKATFPSLISVEQDFANSFVRWLLYVSPYLHLLEFIAGVLTCQIYLLMRSSGVTISRGWRETLGLAGVAWVAAGLIYNASAPAIATSVSPAAIRYIVDFNFMNMNFLLAPGCCAIILALAVGRCTLQAALAVPAIVGLGEISYSIYLAHPFITQMAYVTKETQYPLLSLVVMLAFLLIFSDGLYRCIEVPAKLFLRRALRAHVGHAPKLFHANKDAG
jgi:peptidoglycan/LPS O-acetylase OafA/YrhL